MRRNEREKSIAPGRQFSLAKQMESTEMRSNRGTKIDKTDADHEAVTSTHPHRGIQAPGTVQV